MSFISIILFGVAMGLYLIALYNAVEKRFFTATMFSVSTLPFVVAAFVLIHGSI